MVNWRHEKATNSFHQCGNCASPFPIAELVFVEAVVNLYTHQADGQTAHEVIAAANKNASDLDVRVGQKSVVQLCVLPN